MELANQSELPDASRWEAMDATLRLSGPSSDAIELTSAVPISTVLELGADHTARKSCQKFSRLICPHRQPWSSQREILATDIRWQVAKSFLSFTDDYGDIALSTVTARKHVVSHLVGGRGARKSDGNCFYG